MPDAPKLPAVIIPAFMESRFVGGVVRGVRQHLEHVLVVDDGSLDATSQVSRDAGAEVMRHDRCRGKGAAIQTGLRYWADRGFDHFLLMDADGQHDSAEIPQFLKALARTGAEVIVGNRMGDVRSMPLVRRWTNRFMSWQIGRLCGHELPDSQCGYRLIHRRLLPALLAASSGFDFETEMLLLAVRAGCRIEFVPIGTIYQNEQSKVRPVRDTIRYCRLIARYRKDARADQLPDVLPNERSKAE